MKSSSLGDNCLFSSRQLTLSAEAKRLPRSNNFLAARIKTISKAWKYISEALKYISKPLKYISVPLKKFMSVEPRICLSEDKVFVAVRGKAPDSNDIFIFLKLFSPKSWFVSQLFVNLHCLVDRIAFWAIASHWVKRAFPLSSLFSKSGKFQSNEGMTDN